MSGERLTFLKIPEKSSALRQWKDQTERSTHDKQMGSGCVERCLQVWSVTSGRGLLAASLTGSKSSTWAWKCVCCACETRRSGACERYKCVNEDGMKTAPFRSVTAHLLRLASNQPPSATTGMETFVSAGTAATLTCLWCVWTDRDARPRLLKALMWRWFHGGWHRSAGRGQREGLMQGGEWKSWRELKKEGYSYRGAPQASNTGGYGNSLSFSGFMSSFPPSLPGWTAHSQCGPGAIRADPALCLSFSLRLSFLFLFATERGSRFPPETHLLLISSMWGEGGAWCGHAKRMRAQEEKDAGGRQQTPQSVSYFFCCVTGHRGEAAERSLAAWVCVKWRERKRKSVRRMAWRHHTTSSLSFIKARSLPLPLFFLSAECSSQAEWSGYSGWCYSRCGVVEVSMLWPCYPGKRESIRGMPGEEETLSKTHFALRLYHCGYLATNKEVHTQADAHVHWHLCTNVNPIRHIGKIPVTEEKLTSAWSLWSQSQMLYMSVIWKVF